MTQHSGHRSRRPYRRPPPGTFDAPRRRIGAGLAAAALMAAGAIPTSVQASNAEVDLSQAAAQAEEMLHQSFGNLRFEDFGPSPVQGPLYQANAGGRMLYFAPQSGHLLFATVYDRGGTNLTALAQEASAHRRLAAIDPGQALVLGPDDAPTVIEFTDPDCPYCRALDRFWASKAAEGKPVRRLIYFVSGIHPMAAAKAEHIACSPDKAAAFAAIYAGLTPERLTTCPDGQGKVARDADLVAKVGIGGTPTVIAGGKIISGFQQAELETFLAVQSRSGPEPFSAAPD